MITNKSLPEWEKCIFTLSKILFEIHFNHSNDESSFLLAWISRSLDTFEAAEEARFDLSFIFIRDERQKKKWNSKKSYFTVMSALLAFSLIFLSSSFVVCHSFSREYARLSFLSREKSTWHMVCSPFSSFLSPPHWYVFYVIDDDDSQASLLEKKLRYKKKSKKQK